MNAAGWYWETTAAAPISTDQYTAWYDWPYYADGADAGHVTGLPVVAWLHQRIVITDEEHTRVFAGVLHLEEPGALVEADYHDGFGDCLHAVTPSDDHHGLPEFSGRELFLNLPELARPAGATAAELTPIIARELGGDGDWRRRIGHHLAALAGAGLAEVTHRPDNPHLDRHLIRYRLTRSAK